ncbi:DUF4129 domain-containing protein [Kaarinaea lacus]
MRVDNICVALRPRSVWEAIDLGFGMARLWWGPLLKSWLLLALPVFILLSAIFHQYPMVVSLLFWWLKPAYEQLPLVYISRSLFKESLSFRELRRALPRSAMRQLFANLTWRRFSLVRSFAAPVAQLENLSGKQRQQRLQVLMRGYNGAGWLTVVGVHLEAILYTSILLLVWFVMPEQIEIAIWFDQHKLLVEFGSNVVYFIAAAIIAPFFVSSGFSLYLNRRAQLEGWDIELEFRLLQQRLSKQHKPAPTSTAAMVACLLSGMMAISVFVSDASAQEAETPVQYEAVVDHSEAKRIINEVLADEDFGKKETVKRWRFKGELTPSDTDPSSINTNFMLVFAQIGEILLWIFVALLIIAILYNLPRWRMAISKPSLSRPRTEPVPTMLFGLDVTEESLPDDVAAEALRLFQEKKVRRALSLLYRGSLAVLVNRYGVALKASNTEGECAQHVSHTQIDTIANYFGELTRVWVQLAYGHQFPPQETVESLCNNWRVHFGETQ